MGSAQEVEEMDGTAAQGMRCIMVRYNMHYFGLAPFDLLMLPTLMVVSPALSNTRFALRSNRFSAHHITLVPAFMDM